MLNKFNDSVKQQLDKAKDLMDCASDKMTDLKDAGWDKIKAGMDELYNGLPLIEEAGFKVNDITIDIGIPPDVGISFTKTNQVDAATIENMIEQNQDKKILSMVLATLLNANKMQEKITMNKFTFSGLAIRVGIPPKVSLRYK